MPATRLCERVIARLVQAEVCEPNPHFRDDLKIARLTVAYAASGEAVLCSPHVLATYAVLGLHPEKVWPAIEARRNALGPLCAAPKKPAQSVKLWLENTNAARATNSRGGETLLRDNTTAQPMAAPSIAALYPNSDAPSSAKKRGFTYGEMLAIVKFSGAPHSVRHATLNALSARGRWPNEDGPASGIICVSLDGMMLGNEDGAGNVVRSTARWRARQAVKHGYWQQLRKANSWSNCRKCGAERATGKCEKCGYRGRSKTPEGKANFDEFCRPHMYEIDIEKFRTAERAKGIRHFDARTYADHKAAAKRGEHPNLMEMPRKSPQPDPHPPATAAPIRQPAAEHAHRNPARIEPPQPKMTKREAAKFVADMALVMRGRTKDGFGWKIEPGSEGYVAPMNWRAALKEVCESWHRTEESVVEALKFFGYRTDQHSP
jgi:hypothetical protein